MKGFEIMSRSLVKRVAPYLIGRVRENHRMLNFSSVSALTEASSSSSQSESSSSLDVVHLSENCIRVCMASAFFEFVSR